MPQIFIDLEAPKRSPNARFQAILGVVGSFVFSVMLMSFVVRKRMLLWSLSKGNWRGWQLQSWYACQGESFLHDSQVFGQFDDIVSPPTNDDGVASRPQALDASASGVLQSVRAVLMDALNIPFPGMSQKMKPAFWKSQLVYFRVCKCLDRSGELLRGKTTQH